MIASRGWVVSSSWPTEIIVPQDEFGGCTPAPRKERPASKSMFPAMLRVKKTMMVEAMLGRISANITRQGPAPCAIAASTNSFWPSASTSPRIGRATYGMLKMLITMIGFQIEPDESSSGPILRPPTASEIPNPSPIRKTGSDQRTSSVRAITASGQPL
jgi:hypothetical protein